MNQKTMRIYGCGGTGINIARQIEQLAFSNTAAKTEVVLVDTSTSNIPTPQPDNFHLIADHGEGSGKIRKHNYQEIANKLAPFMAEFPAGDFNVAIFSSAGGSGSVIGPVLMGRLMAEGKPVVGLVVGAAADGKEAQNTVDCFKSLAGVASAQQVPIVINYQHNSPQTPRSEIDKIFHGYTEAISLLASGLNDEMDAQDLYNWLFFNRSTDLPPQLTLIEMYDDGEALVERNNPISIASLYTSRDQPKPATTAEYSCNGYREDFPATLAEMHFAITAEPIQEIFDLREKDNERFIQASRARATTHNSLLGDTNGMQDDGMVI